MSPLNLLILALGLAVGGYLGHELKLEHERKIVCAKKARHARIKEARCVFDSARSSEENTPEDLVKLCFNSQVQASLGSYFESRKVRQKKVRTKLKNLVKDYIIGD